MSSELAKQDYRHPQSELTLQQGLRQYYEKNPGYQDSEGFLGQSQAVIQAHDIIHVVFACGTASADELVIETWTFFGCRVPVQEYIKAGKNGFINQVWNMFGPYRLVKRFILTFPRILHTLFNCIRLKRRWPHFEYEMYLPRTLTSIRAEFGIHVV